MKTALIRRGLAALVLTVFAGVAGACGANDLTAPGDDNGPICYEIGGDTFCTE